jgi:hypothetical protein
VAVARAARVNLLDRVVVYDVWQHVDAAYASLSSRNLRKRADSVTSTLGEILGPVGRRLANAMRSRGLQPLARSATMRARVRTECAAMLFYREKFGARSGTRELLLDSSDFLRRGVLAIRENILVFTSPDELAAPSVTSRRFVPVALAHGHTSAVDKAMAALHSIWLDYGPSMRSMRRVLGSVRAIPTDFGPESLFANSKELPPSFFWCDDAATRPRTHFPFRSSFERLESPIGSCNQTCRHVLRRLVSVLERRIEKAW